MQLEYCSRDIFIVRAHRVLASVLAVLLLSAGLGQASQIGTSRVASGLDRPVYVTAPPDDTDRLFIVEQHTGRIKILNLNTGLVNGTPFLDIDGLASGNEQGLLGLAFHPSYAANGFFYVNFNNSSGTTNIRRYKVSAGNPDIADAGSATTVLTYSQPQSNHNGGWVGFGPDGFLYISSGDGGGSDDNDSGHTPGVGNSQDITENLLGKLLRIDVNGDDFPGDAGRNYAIPNNNPFVGVTGDDEIWAYGLRNPWRASFDRATGDLYIADVGQNAREEIDFQAAASPGGENYGWRLREGMIATPTGGVGGSRPPGSIDPIYDYTHGGGPTQGHSVSGGYVYRGLIAELQGHYFFADYVSENIWSFRYDGANLTDFTNRTAEFIPDVGTIGAISSFGEDACGNLYIVDLGGEVFKIVSKPAIRGDFTGDCNINIADFAMFALAWLSRPGDVIWNPIYDISEPSGGIIDMLDLDVFTGNWLGGPPSSRKASNPSPSVGATGVSTSAVLSWTAGFGATSHDVYFGTSSPPSFIHDQNAATFDPGTMVVDTKYYWRIDEVSAWGTTTGTVWTFTTRGGGR